MPPSPRALVHAANEFTEVLRRVDIYACWTQQTTASRRLTGWRRVWEEGSYFWCHPPPTTRNVGDGCFYSCTEWGKRRSYRVPPVLVMSDAYAGDRCAQHATMMLSLLSCVLIMSAPAAQANTRGFLALWLEHHHSGGGSSTTPPPGAAASIFCSSRAVPAGNIFIQA